MAEDKRIRIAADTTPLRQLREEAVSLYREINQTSMQSAQEADKSISQLREQLALMEDRNELERLLLTLKDSLPPLMQPQYKNRLLCRKDR